MKYGFGYLWLVIIAYFGFILSACSIAETKVGNERKIDGYLYLSGDSTIGDLVKHQVIKDFAYKILPWDNKDYDMDMKMSEIDNLLPYHTHVDTGSVIAPLNYMIDEMNTGNVVFYDFYSEEEKQNDSSKENTGLFFFRGEENAPFAVINAGGGFSYVGSLHEGFPYALEISKQGYNAFVLKYRTGSGQSATEDLAAAISYIFENAEDFGVSKECYSVWGSSAGARMASNIGTYGVEEFGGDNVPNPTTVVTAYTGHTDYSENDPPTFAVVGENDGIANPDTMENRIHALSAAGIDTEFHEYPGLEHGFGLGVGTSAEGWIADAVAFWKKQIVLGN
ncbi:alpha/beta hydrolase [Candidatus Pristimantibacillus sp. PTI5]|uniref:alpha/beta hydrolase n=1 Tax=Candidatus Pristimantibacillus sp. PTI5 TaxID=3400422 RepID=UPI003B012459